MIGYGDRARTQCEVVRLFRETHPDLPPLNQGTISKIEAQYREMGHVRKVPSKRQAVVDDDTKLNLLLALEENPNTPARQLARDIISPLKSARVECKPLFSFLQRSLVVAVGQDIETHPDLPPLNQGTISKIEAQYREMGHVRKVPSKRQAVVDDDTKLNLLLDLEENPITPARQLARDTTKRRSPIFEDAEYGGGVQYPLRPPINPSTSQNSPPKVTCWIPYN
ncbi:hypothetical protein NQ318_012351 [Aromia moschata]|uniref:DUF4817 domain-containing protein n=1 Tax=Aromia moschata TaxID=1265417 RepID=A0AAV8XHV5_9CUCU|nr:hypothetical protein NQ318_012351 [Aromia moschata]